MTLPSRLLRTALIATSLLTALAASASEIGHWHGYGESETDRRFIIPCIDILTPPTNQRYFATLTLDDGAIIPCIFPVDFTRSSAGIITGNGVDEHGHRILIHGRSKLLGDGSVRIAAFQYKQFQWHGGIMDQGHIAVLQMIGGTDWNNLEGAHVEDEFEGSYTPVGERAGAVTGALANIVEGDIRGVPTTRFEGELTFLGVNLTNPPDPVVPGPYDLRFAMAGTVGLPAVQSDGNTRAPFAGLGLVNPPDPIQPSAIALLVGSVLHFNDGSIIPCVIPGEYRLYHRVADLFADVFHGSESSFSRGEFFLPAVQ